ncbi:MAG: hypothetical protein N2A42_07475, partial [Luteolibacter sp.]
KRGVVVSVASIVRIQTSSKPLRLCASPPLEIGSHRVRIEKSRAKPQSRKATSHSIMVGRIRLGRP